MPRVILGALCLGISLAPSAVAPAPHFPGLWLLFVAYSCFALLGKGPDRNYPLLSLSVDGVFFLVAVAMPSDYFVGITCFFYLFLILSAAFLHSAREVVITAVFAVTLLYFLRPQASDALVPALILSGAAVTVMATQKEALQRRLAAAAKETDRIRGEVEAAREAERRRIAADFHDGPLQSFAGFQMRLEVLKKIMEREPEKALEEIDELQELTRAQASELRAFIQSLRSGDAGGTELLPSIRRLLDVFSRESGIPAELSAGDLASSLNAQVAPQILQIIREALHNVWKHANASRVAVMLSRTDDVLEITVKDNGKGFPFHGIYNLEELELLQLGPASIRRRVQNLDGALILESRSNTGTSLRIRIPA